MCGGYNLQLLISAYNSVLINCMYTMVFGINLNLNIFIKLFFYKFNDVLCI